MICSFKSPNAHSCKCRYLGSTKGSQYNSSVQTDVLLPSENFVRLYTPIVRTLPPLPCRSSCFPFNPSSSIAALQELAPHKCNNWFRSKNLLNNERRQMAGAPGLSPATIAVDPLDTPDEARVRCSSPRAPFSTDKPHPVQYAFEQACVVKTWTGELLMTSFIRLWSC